MENIVFNSVIVLIAVVGFLAILACVGFYRGWFRLASTPAGRDAPFVLMRKKDKTREGEK